MSYPWAIDARSLNGDSLARFDPGQRFRGAADSLPIGRSAGGVLGGHRSAEVIVNIEVAALGEQLADQHSEQCPAVPCTDLCPEKT